jgi:hypothetical protein
MRSGVPFGCSTQNTVSLGIPIRRVARLVARKTARPSGGTAIQSATPFQTTISTQIDICQRD